MLADDTLVRHDIYTHFADHGHPPSVTEIPDHLRRPISEVEVSLEYLEDGHDIVLTPGAHNRWMAHPFSALPFSSQDHLDEWLLRDSPDHSHVTDMATCWQLARRRYSGRAERDWQRPATAAIVAERGLTDDIRDRG